MGERELGQTQSVVTTRSCAGLSSCTYTCLQLARMHSDRHVTYQRSRSGSHRSLLIAQRKWDFTRRQRRTREKSTSFSVYLGLIVWGSLSVFPLFACPATAQCTSIIQRRSLGFQCKANHRWSSVLMGSCYTWLLCSKT